MPHQRKSSALTLKPPSDYIRIRMWLLVKPSYFSRYRIEEKSGASLDRAEIHSLATDASVLEQVDMLNETLESLRRRMARLARMV